MEPTKGNDNSTPSNKNVLPQVQSKFGHSTPSPFKVHSFQTPPSRLGRIRNPFLQQYDQLEVHLSSPSVCNLTKLQMSTEKFKWTIDELAMMQPVDIDNHMTLEQFQSPGHDSDMESLVQSRVDKYFSSTEIIPSPYGVPNKQLPLLQNSLTPEKNKTDVATQTTLTLPAVLPEEVEAVLKPYFSYTDCQSDTSANKLLYRQLFEPHCDSVQSSPAKSVDLNLPPISTNVFMIKTNGGGVSSRTFCTPSRDDKLKECELSPISSVGSPIQPNRVNLASHMSIDTSFNVPDLGELPASTSIEGMDKSKSFTEESLISNSTVNWDVEYNHIISSPAANLMDVSNSNTPKSKRFLGNVKKLSDSFETDFYENSMVPMSTYNSQEDLTDAGYQTGSTVSCSNNSLFASTPTKQKLL